MLTFAEENSHLSAIDMEDQYNLKRFLDAQDEYGMYDIAMSELKRGRKRSHWIWYVFPQIKGLGFSYNSQYYGISSIEEAKQYLDNPILRERLFKACSLLKEQAALGKSMEDVLGGIDSVKVRSSLTLFDAASPHDVFEDCLLACYDGKKDTKTLELLNVEQ